MKQGSNCKPRLRRWGAAFGLAALWSVPGHGAPRPAASPPQEETCLVSVLRNGDFREEPSAAIGGIPWWAPIGRGGAVLDTDFGRELRLEGEGASVKQPVPAFGPYVGDVILRGRVRGHGELLLYGGGTASHEFRGRQSFVDEFEVVLRDASKLQGKLRPRLLVQLAGASSDGVAVPSFWSGIEVLAPLPCPSEDALRAELVGLLERHFEVALTACLDDVGARPTPFRAFDFDADSGERMGAPDARVGDVALAELLLRAWRAAPRPAWEEALGAFCEAYLELCIHPETGLERRWDPRADRPLDDFPVQIHRGLAFLLDVAEHGPEAWRAPSLAAAERMARAVLEHGVLPDGAVAASYRPADGAPDFGVPHIRRLDVPAQLARVAAATADPALALGCLRAAEEACLTLAYDHFWPGDWANIDPGFDDNYGHYGARAAVMWEAHPDNQAFRALVMSGWERYAPLWRDALRYGGNIAADQVRCWRIAARIAELAPEHASEVAILLDAAAHAHFQGEQLSGGAWIDVTVKNFNPIHVPVGDTAGVPQNLLEGLGVVYGERELGLATDAMRARFTAVLRTTVAEFGRARGFASGRGAKQPASGYRGSTYAAAGMVAMLEALSR